MQPLLNGGRGDNLLVTVNVNIHIAAHRVGNLDKYRPEDRWKRRISGGIVNIGSQLEQPVDGGRIDKLAVHIHGNIRDPECGGGRGPKGIGKVGVTGSEPVAGGTAQQHIGGGMEKIQRQPAHQVGLGTGNDIDIGNHTSHRVVIHDRV